MSAEPCLVTAPVRDMLTVRRGEAVLGPLVTVCNPDGTPYDLFGASVTGTVGTSPVGTANGRVRIDALTGLVLWAVPASVTSLLPVGIVPVRLAMAFADGQPRCLWDGYWTVLEGAVV